MISKRAQLIALAVVVSGVTAASACGESDDSELGSADVASSDRVLVDLGPSPEFPPAPLDSALVDRAARVAWDFFLARERAGGSGNGLMPATEGYDRVSIWDVGSTLAAYHSAHELGLLDERAFMERTGRLLETLASVPLYDDAVLNKAYVAADGTPAGADGAEGNQPTGWSALDLGRLLVWLHVVRTHHPGLAAQAERVVERMDLARTVQGGVLGEGPDFAGRTQTYQEGKLGYEQYAARGFELWGHPAEQALDLHANAEPFDVDGTPLLRDRRGGERLTSDPFVLLGLELGWTAAERRLALGILDAQRRRWEATDQITIVGEDALDRPPHYFYYYGVQQDGRPFSVGAHGADDDPDAPRWVSAKSAWGWYALVPTAYTRLAVDAVAPAALPGRGWRSGVYEGTGEPAGIPNLNAAAVILEAALYARRGAPLVEAG
jgi:hypothetical protein